MFVHVVCCTCRPLCVKTTLRCWKSGIFCEPSTRACKTISTLWRFGAFLCVECNMWCLFCTTSRYCRVPERYCFVLQLSRRCRNGEFLRGFALVTESISLKRHDIVCRKHALYILVWELMKTFKVYWDLGHCRCKSNFTLILFLLKYTPTLSS